MASANADGVTIRMATADDAEILADMVAQLAAFERMSHINRCCAATLRAELERPDRTLEAIIALQGDTAVGMAAFFTTYSTFAGKRGLYLEDMFVIPEWRHRGIGTALLRHVARLAVARDYGRMEWMSLIWNSSATEFYESLGATPNDAWTTYRLLQDGMRRLAGLEAAAASS